MSGTTYLEDGASAFWAALFRSSMAGKTRGGAPFGLRDGARCNVVGGTHAGKSGTVRDIKVGATFSQKSITVVQDNGERFKTLAKNVQMV